MYSFMFLVSVGAVLVFSFMEDMKVTAAPAPHPCLWMLDYGRRHPEPTTTSTAKPDIVENLAKLRNKKTNQLEKLVTDWIMWGPNGDGQNQKPRSRNKLDRMISGYMKILANIFSTF